MIDLNEYNLAFNTGKVTNPAGLRLNGQKFFIVVYDKDSSTMYLKKEKGGACAVKTNKTIVIGTFDQSQKQLVRTYIC